MDRYVAILISAIALITSFSSAAESGKIEIVGPSSIDFGKYQAWEKKVAKYKIRNVGKGTLKIIKIRKTCGCASAAADKMELKPGDEATVSVTILPNSIFGLYSKNTFVETSDPGNRFLRLTVAGNAVPLVHVKPKKHVYAGRIKLFEPWSQSFSLKGTRSDFRLGRPRVKSSHEVKTTLARKTEGAGDILTVKLLPVTESGDFQCSIELPVIFDEETIKKGLVPTNHPPVKVSIAGKIGYQLNAVPGILRIPVSETPIKKTFYLRVMGQRSRVLRPDEVTLPEHKEASFALRDGGRRGLAVTATFSSEFTKELFAEKKLPLTFSVPGASSVNVTCKTR